MGMMDKAPSSERVHIGFFGIRNAGKSSVVNAVTEQDLSVVSETKGTTTDPVQKAMEITPIGPVVVIDTPGFDDVGSLGEKRVKKTKEILNRVDIAVLVIDGTIGLHQEDKELIEIFREKKLPYVIAKNKSDLIAEHEVVQNPEINGEDKDAYKIFDYDGNRFGEIEVSAKTGYHIFELRSLIGQLGKATMESKGLLDGIASDDGQDAFILVIPQDTSAPKGRLILPEQMMIHEILDHHGEAICCQPEELERTIDFMQSSNKKLRMVITDSQAFKHVNAVVPDEIPLASFSILMARYKGVLETAARGVTAVDTIQDGDIILMAEGCTHHRQCDDIGTVKIPNWIREYTGKDIKIETSSGYGFPEDLTKYHMIIHCGACMINEREVRFRMNQAIDQGVPFTNYGITISYMNGILQRNARAIKELSFLLEK